MNSYSAQGSITIKRLRNGDTLFISFDNNGNPLYQGVDPVSGAVSPDWTNPDNQPMLTPKVTTARGAAITLSNHAWKYNGNDLVFNGETDGDFAKDSTGKFEMNPSTGALKIIANLASKTNYANDTLSYSCTATLGGLEYNLSKDADITIQSSGASSYTGTIVATTEQITAAVPTATLRTDLHLATTDYRANNKDYHVKWYKQDLSHPWSAKDGQKDITVGRDDVNGTTLFIAEFYESSSSTTPVCRAGIRIIDASDDFQIVYVITSANKTVDDGKPVTVTGKIVNMRTNTEVTATGATWVTKVMDKKTWTATQTVNSNTVTITTADTDTENGQNDVEVVGSVTWND